MDNHKLQEWYIYHQCLVRFFSVTRKLVRNQLLQVVILSYQISLVIRPVLLPKSYLSCAVPLALLLILQLYIAFLIIISPQLFKISHSSMLPAVVFFPNALHLQRKKKKNQNNPTDLDFFEPYSYCFSAPETNGSNHSLL